MFEQQNINQGGNRHNHGPPRKKKINLIREQRITACLQTNKEKMAFQAEKGATIKLKKSVDPERDL